MSYGESLYVYRLAKGGENTDSPNISSGSTARRAARRIGPRELHGGLAEAAVGEYAGSTPSARPPHDVGLPGEQHRAKETRVEPRRLHPVGLRGYELLIANSLLLRYHSLTPLRSSVFSTMWGTSLMSHSSTIHAV